MAKRRFEGYDPAESSTKRPRLDAVDRISKLSDELLLRILSFLPIQTLVVCQRLSRKFCEIAGDSQLWKAAYYNRFVRPRVKRLPGLKESPDSPNNLLFSSKVSKWLDEEHLLRRERDLEWKRQYKLRHNWSRGSCVVNEIQVSERSSTPPLLVRMHNGVIFAADSSAGLRAWSSKGSRELIAITAFVSNASIEPAPTSLAIDGFAEQSGCQRIAVGYEDGRFDIYEFQPGSSGFRKLYRHPPSSNGMLTAIAYHSPYLITMTDSQVLSLYGLPSSSGDDVCTNVLEPPRLLQSLKSHTASSPLSLSIRHSGNKLVVSIAFTLATYLGFSVGIQEMHLSSAGVLVESRLATAADSEYKPLSSVPSHSSRPRDDASSDPETGSGYMRMLSIPTSLSYTHPYLLVAHPDNTLTFFIVKSTTAALTISPGNRLWGHTSSVSGAYIGGRGKAVSVSTRGDDLRVWELEGGLCSSGRRRVASGELSVRVRPEERSISDDLGQLTEAILRRGSGLGLALEHRPDDTSITRGWIGFDEENVVLLREKNHGAQALIVYDFT